MTTEQIVYFVILFIAFYLLFTEKLKNDIVAVLIILALAITRILDPKEALAGFGSEPAIIAATVFILSEALHQTGISELIGELIGRLVGRGYKRVIVILMMCVAGLASVTHHVTITAMMLPITLNIGKERKIAGSKLLIPLSFAASLGTTMTVISAPAFLVASGTLQSAGYHALGIFSITPLGLALVATGILFMLAIGQFILPNRETSMEAGERAKITNYFTEVIIQPNSSFIGKTLAQVKTSGRYHFTVVSWMRKGERLAEPLGDERIQAGDILHLHTTPEDITTFRDEKGVDYHPVKRFQPFGQKNQDDLQLVQAVVASNSEFVNLNLREIDFRRRFGGVVIGFYRQGEFLQEELSLIRLKAGDVLVIQADEDAVARLEHTSGFSMLAPHHEDGRVYRKAPIAGAIVLIGILLSAFRILPVEIAMLSAALAIVLTKTLSLKQAYKAIDIRIYIFIAGAIPLGTAMQSTGAAQLMADGLRSLIGNWHPFWLLFTIYMIVGLITQLMSDAATVALFAPIALSFAQALGHQPEAYVITVAMAAVTACITPTGHHGNLLVYGPGRYQFMDFVRVGLPLTVLMGIVVAALAPILWAL
ncbi:MAG TPA: SLC13 family permease [Anaerolineales bacterium]|nr:SLC13 family permease [Anaerolineales bacterium]